VELRLDLVGSAAPSTRELHVEGWALDVGPGAGSGRVEIRDDAGSLVAHGVGVMAIDGSIGAAAAQVGGRFDPADAVVHVRSADGAVVAAPLSAGMINSMGTVHGGVLTALAALAQECFLHRHGPTRPLSLAVEFLRPAHLGADVLMCHSSFTRRGRRFWAVRTELRRPDGVPVLRASGTSLVQ
jgi:acyl-coenzyme A thioesterase PaaI-like protein